MNYTKLSNRGQIILSGEETKDFLQGLITNNINKLDNQAQIYAWLLTPQGKFLHDFYITRQDGKYYLDCEGGKRTEDLYTRLKRYRLRRPIEIEAHEQIDTYVLWDENTISRTYTKPDNADEKSIEDWQLHRIKNCIPDGTKDMTIEKSTPLECNLDKLDGVDFKKGCYVGQELVSRIHNRGLLKKRLYPIKFETKPDFLDIRSTQDQYAIALIKDAQLEELEPNKVEIITFSSK